MIAHIDDRLDLESKKIFSYNKVSVIDKYNRVGNREGNRPLNNDELRKFFRRAIDGILESNVRFTETFQTSIEFIVFSRTLLQAMLIEWTGNQTDGNQVEDTFDSAFQKCVNVLKFFPRNKLSDNSGITINKYSGLIELYSDELFKYIDSLMDYYELKRVLHPENIYYTYNPAEIPIENSKWNDHWEIIFMENTLLDFYPWNILEVF
jgi:hypothetical protein